MGARRRDEASTTTVLTLLREEPSAALALRSTRAQPGLLVQGDTLSVAMEAAEAALSALRTGALADARESAEEVVGILREWQGSYERMMHAARRELPYFKG